MRDFEMYEQIMLNAAEGFFFGKALYNINKVYICGVVEEAFEYSHTLEDENFYRGCVIVRRYSGTVDYIPVLVSERNKKDVKYGDKVKIVGRLKSRRDIGSDGKYHSRIYLYITKMYIVDILEESNLIYLEGEVFKEPYFKLSALNHKEICNIYIRVKDNRNSFNYIPCITWNEFAYLAREMKVGDHVRLYGRIQSRKYCKDFMAKEKPENWKTIYEVSVLYIEKIEE